MEEERPRQVLVREIQIDPLSLRPLHVDLHEFAPDQTIVVRVPVRLKGAAAGLAEGGELDQPLHEISVECRPAAIPEAIEADVSGLGIGGSLHVRDLALPEGVRAEVGADILVVQCRAAQEEEPEAAEAAAVEAEPAAPEVIGRKRAEDEEE